MYAPLDFPLPMALHLFPNWGPRILGIQSSQLAQDFLGALILHLRSRERHFYNLISMRALARVQYAFFPQAELLPVLRPRWNLQQRAPIDRGNLDLGAQSGLADCNRHADFDIVA